MFSRKNYQTLETMSNTNGQTRQYVGLDIGSSGVVAVIGEFTGGNRNTELLVKGIGYVALGEDAVKKGRITNVQKVSNAIRQVVAEAGEQAGIIVGDVYASVCLPDVKFDTKTQSMVLERQNSDVNVHDVDRLSNSVRMHTKTSDYEILHLLPQEYTVERNTDIIDVIGSPGKDLTGSFGIVTISQEEKKKIARSIENTPSEDQKDFLSINNFFMAPLAAGISTLTQKDREDGVALVDIGGGTTSVAIYYKNIVRHVAVLPWGGDTIKRDLMEGLELSSSEAEEMKVKYGNARSEDVSENQVVLIKGGRTTKNVLVKNVALIMEERLIELASLVEAEISHSGFGNSLASGIVLTGGSSKIPNIAELFKRVTTRLVTAELPTIDLHPNCPQEIKNPSFATAIGLVWLAQKPLDYREEYYATLRGRTPKDEMRTAPVSSSVHTPPQPAATTPAPKKDNWFKSLKDVVMGSNNNTNSDQWKP
jgi:cell division protein FtsA